MFHLSGVGDSIKVRITISDYWRIKGPNNQKNKYQELRIDCLLVSCEKPNAL